MSVKLILPDPVEETVWLRAWCAVASDTHCLKTEIPTSWADDCLKEFKKRFRKDIPNEEKSK